MKYLLFYLLTFSLLNAYEWIPICDENIKTYDLSQHEFGYPVVLACEDGLLMENGDEWMHVSSGFPVRNLLHFSDHEFLLIQGNGSYSDGIYKFNEYTSEFELIELFYNPNFLIYNWVDNEYYAGGEDGLYKSSNGDVWEEVVYFSGLNCEDIVFWDNHIVVSVSGNIYGVYCSDDHGSTWNTPGPDSLHITDISFAIDNK